MQIRHLEYLVTLEREGHFARAAARCNVSQPTLSSGLSALEEQLGARLIERDRRYIGLTAEGRAVLPWAQAMLAAHTNMSAAASVVRGPLKGTLRLGAIPASMPSVGHFARAMREAHRGVEVDIRSLTSREIEAELAAFRLDAGITYIDHDPPANVSATPLYAERPMLVVAHGHHMAQMATTRFERALEEPLCLLHQGMQNRRILDEHLAARGLTAAPLATADSYVALLALARSGAFVTIMPDSYRTLLPDWAHTLTFEEPSYESRIGLIIPDRLPRSPLGEAAAAVARDLDLPFDR
ncbi:LysR family transcriptional regulator [Sphingomonas montanisoli]|uniref:LysR family transcriptional regulator n=1 Tax=Sphingomonas montanisoli TaxID=2606412 RepID=A0A5D9C7Y0_9SPHN|nr:LysR family transcriptional regulator [Sphingomonas montanisoli]TZG27874.1 LysR family transcriptional regulator [Sphingomonas montanisoli]